MRQAVAAVLCTSLKSTWDAYPVECFNARRDARTYSGALPVIAHPPCRSWSRACRHQARPLPGERELGLFCIEQVVRCGGVLEQPAGSLLFEHLPAGGFVQWVAQAWWGFKTLKPTWLWWYGVPVPEPPFSLVAASPNERQVWSWLSAKQRSDTPSRFAEWLLDAVSPRWRPIALYSRAAVAECTAVKSKATQAMRKKADTAKVPFRSAALRIGGVALDAVELVMQRDKCTLRAAVEGLILTPPFSSPAKSKKGVKQ